MDQKIDENCRIKSLKYTLISGLLASLASVFGKISTTPQICENYLFFLLNFIGKDDYLRHNFWLTRAMQSLSFIMMIVVNSLMWMQFTLALAYGKNTIQITTINMTTNFICSAIFGFMLFDESISIKWTIGITLILSGIILLKRNDRLTNDYNEKSQ